MIYSNKEIQAMYTATITTNQSLIPEYEHFTVFRPKLRFSKKAAASFFLKVVLSARTGI